MRIIYSYSITSSFIRIVSKENSKHIISGHPHPCLFLNYVIPIEKGVQNHVLQEYLFHRNNYNETTSLKCPRNYPVELKPGNFENTSGEMYTSLSERGNLE